jgi:hypothetical protein
MFSDHLILGFPLIVKGVNASEPLVAKLMAKAQLRSIIRKKFVDFQFIVGSASPK